MQLKEKEKKNIDVGSFLLKRLQTEASDQEMDKYKLHVEEMDKVTSLILGLASRLARLDLSHINKTEDTEMVSSNDDTHYTRDSLSLFRTLSRTRKKSCWSK